jgi:predicted DNA-binding transcriptional regulator AlpA
MARLGIGHTKFYADIKAKRLPQLVHLGPRCVGHIEEELEAYIKRLKAERDERTCSSARDRRSRPRPAVTS